MSTISQSQTNNSVVSSATLLAPSLSTSGCSEHVEFIDEASKEIFQRKEHALLLISPCNSYYNSERIDKTIQWLLNQQFADFHLFTAEGMWYYNFQAFGYSPEEAAKKMRIKQNQLYNKLYPIMDKYAISRDKILSTEILAKNQVYQKFYKNGDVEALQNKPFVQVLHETTADLKNSGTRSEPIAPSFFIQAFAIEIPLFLYSPSILGVSSSCVIYHQNNAIYDYIFVKQKMNEQGQGFFVLNFP